MNEKKLVHNFKSYINVSQKKSSDNKNGSIQEVVPKLLKGEALIGSADSVLMLLPLCEQDNGRFGSLFVTNYRLSFLPTEDIPTNENCQRNLLLSLFDVPLTCVGSVWLTEGEGSRRRRLTRAVDLPDVVRGLQLVCKNMKVMSFSFLNSPIGSGRKIASSLLHHAFPKKHDLLFAFECCEPYYASVPAAINMFTGAADWKRELDRCSGELWRVSQCNGAAGAVTPRAGPALVVPRSVLECEVAAACRLFRGGAAPAWTWGRRDGAALLRGGELQAGARAAASAEGALLEQVRRSHPKLKPPHVIHLCGNPYVNSAVGPVLPSLSALQASFKKLVDLCTPATLANFWAQDSAYYSLLESSRWLRYVSLALSFADEAAQRLEGNETVVLQEGEGVDYCAVVSSLTQLMLDPSSRTLVGFQSLLQKEWLAFGHPFADRLGLPRAGTPRDPALKDPMEQPAPVFLLFLDCVWQLTNQCPDSFQFSGTFLATLWDCVHNALFDTFIFNSPRERDLAVAKNYIQRPLWDWGEQFSESDQALFYNPLYIAKQMQETARPQRPLSQPALIVARQHRLSVKTSPGAVVLWSQCYERWLQPLDSPYSGDQLYHIHHIKLLKDIQKLKDKISSLSIMSDRRSFALEQSDAEGGEEGKGEPFPFVTRFFPFSSHRSGGSGGLEAMQVSLVDASQLLDSQSLLNASD